MALPLPETSVADLTYEQARLELLSIVTKLERRDLPLEDTLPLWHRADALARPILEQVYDITGMIRSRRG